MFEKDLSCLRVSQPDTATCSARQTSRKIVALGEVDMDSNPQLAAAIRFQAPELVKLSSCDFIWEHAPAGYFFDQHHQTSIMNLTLGSCEVQTERRHWCSHRIGPFISSGGGLFTHGTKGGTNAFGASVPLRCRSTIEMKNIQIDGSVSAPVSIDGQIIPSPPVYMHHSYFVPPSAFAHKVDDACLPSVLPGHTESSWMCSSTDFEKLGVVYDPFHLVFEGSPWIAFRHDDLRPRNSPQMTFWHHAAYRYSLAQVRHNALLSSFTFYNPIGSISNELVIPLLYESFVYYSGDFPFTGIIFMWQWHGHGSNLQSALLAAEAPENLGLASLTPTTFRHDKARKLCEYPIFTAKANGLASNEAVRQLIMSQMPEKKLICNVVASPESTMDVRSPYERCPEIRCKTWTVTRGHMFTVVAFFAPNLFLDDVAIQQHAIFLASYLEAEASVSQVDCGTYSRYGLGKISRIFEECTPFIRFTSSSREARWIPLSFVCVLALIAWSTKLLGRPQLL